MDAKALAKLMAAAMQRLQVDLEGLRERFESLNAKPSIPGSRGEQGPPGPCGARGVPGESGPKGTQGERGEQGPMGNAGPAGLRGERGERGLPGDRGESGTQGQRGEAGPRGDIGERGPSGEQGPNGERGEQGPRGLSGARGEKGERGDQGTRGQEGKPGKNGKDGERGPQGTEGQAGPMPRHEWDDTRLRFEQPWGWGPWVDLKGPPTQNILPYVFGGGGSTTTSSSVTSKRQVTVSSDYTVEDDVGTVLVTGSGNVTVTLADPATRQGPDERVTVKQKGTGTATVSGGGFLIDGLSSISLAQQYAGVMLEGDSSSWSIV